MSLTDRVWKLILSFKAVWLAFILIVVTSTVVSFVSAKDADILDMLSVSRETPWGVFTSIFSNTTPSHLTTNMNGLFLFMFAFCVTNSLNRKKEREKRARFMAITIFLIAIISNLFWLLLSESGATGSSGMVFASQGVTLLFALMNIPKLFDYIKSGKKMIPALILFVVIVVIGSVFVSVFKEIVTFSRLMETKQNALVHLISFTGGFLFWFLYIHSLGCKKDGLLEPSH
jgi:membrane associated rhomboid family serine protease